MSRGLLLRFCLKALACLFAALPGTVDALEAGAAKVELEVAPGTPLDGYAWRMGRGAVETHDPLWVRALYLEKDDTRLFLVSADLYSISGALRERVLDFVPGEVPRSQVILTATHTHSGPGGLSASWLERKRSGRFMPEFLEATARRFGEAMRAAYDGRKRAVMGYAVSEEETLTRNAFAEGGVRDTQLGVVRVEDSDGTAIALLANFAATPSTISDRYAFALSADFPGRFCDALEEMSDPGAVAFFLNAASGDQACANPENLRDWDWARSIGESLAQRVKTIADAIECRELKLRVNQMSRELPASVVGSSHPSRAIFQILEINDLLIAFVPGVAYADIGLELRRQAEARGYDAQFTVGPANGGRVTFIPATSFGLAAAENGQTVFGPAIADWLYEGISELMPRGTHKPSRRAAISSEGIESFGGGGRVLLTGAPYERGLQRGMALGGPIRAAYERRVLAAVRAGSIDVALGPWKLARWAIDPAPLALTDLVNESRPLMRGLDESDIEELQGVADGAELPFFAVWLLHAASYFANDPVDPNPAADMLFAVTNDRAEPDGLLVGQALGDSPAELAVVVEVHPERGQGYVAIGNSWEVGVHSGMNDAGIVVCAQRARDLGKPGFDAPPIGFVLRSVLVSEDRFDDALAALRAIEGLRGYRVLVADRLQSEAAVIEFGRETVVRRSVNGLLLAHDEGQGLDNDRHGRAGGVKRYLRRGETIGLAGLEAFFQAKRTATRTPGAFVVYETRERRAHVSFPNDEGAAGTFATLSLEQGRR